MPLITRSVSGWVGGCAEGEKGHFIRRTVWYLNIATHLTASCAIERVGGTCRRELRHRSRAAPGPAYERNLRLLPQLHVGIQRRDHHSDVCVHELIKPVAPVPIAAKIAAEFLHVQANLRRVEHA